ncbi:acyl carrier protein [Phyllobacterium ifriqiyense]|uniref:Acyl carrier protein n=1 Tax=Phyllobacterium ifriqiyense TaxID=314238 RepID=A0ABU0S6V2_9HYPH|nr:acyl carrier protein [Phyllobacterium ifriqiyense]MDQ0995408.1 acyl carrier protein [Phyllobacterium ifriqiyense]
MERSAVREIILAEYVSVIAPKSGALVAMPDDETMLYDTGLDSLGFSVLMARLQDSLEWDPFSHSATSFEPQTFGDFVSFYYNNQP